MPVYIFINLGTISTKIYKIMNHISVDTHQSSLLHESDGSHATKPSSMDVQSYIIMYNHKNYISLVTCYPHAKFRTANRSMP